jgi:tetratricopeptide (TPR) repeat protein
MDENPKDDMEATDDTEQPMTEQEKEALFYAKQAVDTLYQSHIVLQTDQRKEIAFQYALQAFRLAPLHNGLLTILFNICETRSISIFDVLTREEIEQALENPENRKVTTILVAKTLVDIREAIIKGNRAVLPSTPAGIMLLEIITKKESTPVMKALLAMEYGSIGRHLEELQLLKEAAEEDPRHAHLYIEHSHFMQRYKELIEYWERFNPTVREKMEVLVMEAYIRENTGPNSEERLAEMFEGIPVEKYESLEKAKAIAERHYHSNRNMEMG